MTPSRRRLPTEFDLFERHSNSVQRSIICFRSTLARPRPLRRDSATCCHSFPYSRSFLFDVLPYAPIRMPPLTKRLQCSSSCVNVCRSVLQGTGAERKDDRANGWQENTHVQHQGIVRNVQKGICLRRVVASIKIKRFLCKFCDTPRATAYGRATNPANPRASSLMITNGLSKKISTLQNDIFFYSSRTTYR